MKLFILLSLTFIVAACNSSGSGDGDVTSGSINANAPYLWYNPSFPKTLLISDAFDTSETTRIKEMGIAWKTAVENKKTFFNHTANSTPEKSLTIANMDDYLDSVFGVYKSTNWSLTGISGAALAVTQIYGIRHNIGDSNEFVDIRHADIIVNYDYYHFYTGDNRVSGETGYYDLRTVILHEMGHFLGLQHKTGNTVMVTTVDYNVKNRAPTSIDKYDIADKYGISVSSLTSSSQKAMSTTTQQYKPTSNKAQEVRILIELRADGECVHSENGVVIKRHSADLKKL